MWHVQNKTGEWEIHELRSISKLSFLPPCVYIQSFLSKQSAIEWIKSLDSENRDRTFFVVKWVRNKPRKLSEIYTDPRTKLKSQYIVEQKEKWCWDEMKGWYTRPSPHNKLEVFSSPNWK